jgi:S-adenosylmethionine hydrolase
VDPGVGSERSPIVVQAGGYSFVGPDNGIFDMILDGVEGDAGVRRIENPELIAAAAGNTFHGRDIFAPTAAALAAGFPFDAVGRPLEPIVRPGWLETPVDHNGRTKGSILHIDRFGNCVTSFQPDRMKKGAGLRLHIRDRVVDELRSYYADGAGSEPFMIVGSAGFLELAVDRGSAAAALRIQVGDRVIAETIYAPDSKSLAFRAGD